MKKIPPNTRRPAALTPARLMPSMDPPQRCPYSKEKGQVCQGGRDFIGRFTGSQVVEMLLGQPVVRGGCLWPKIEGRRSVQRLRKQEFLRSIESNAMKLEA
jgi:hypothetical protein